MSTNDLSFMQPENEGLVIATSDDSDLNLEARLFIWDFQRPRRFYRGPEINNLIVHRDTLIANQRFPFPRDGIYWRVVDILTKKVVSNTSPNLICSDGVNLYGVVKSENHIDVEKDGVFYSYNPFIIGNVTIDGLDGIIERHKGIQCIIAKGENQFIISEKNFPLLRQDNNTELVLIQLDHEEALASFPRLYTRCMLVYNEELLIGLRFGIYNVNKRKPVRHFSTVDNYSRELTELQDYQLTRQDHQLITKVREFLKQERVSLQKEYDERVDTELSLKLGDAFTVNYMVNYQGQLVYATRNNLYVHGQDEPIWRFRDEIVGLVKIDNTDVLRKIRGKTNIRGHVNLTGKARNEQTWTLAA